MLCLRSLMRSYKSEGREDEEAGAKTCSLHISPAASVMETVFRWPFFLLPQYLSDIIALLLAFKVFGFVDEAP